MRVAAISDIHGNLPALEAVLAEIDREGVDDIVVAGDTVLSRDLAATRGRVAGWRSAARLPRATPPSDAVDREISFGDSLRLRRRIYAT